MMVGLARSLVKSKPWDYFMMVEMGPDRLHHVFWQHFDPEHPKYEAGNRFETAFAERFGVRFAVSHNSGSGTLLSCLLAAGTLPAKSHDQVRAQFS